MPAAELALPALLIVRMSIVTPNTLVATLAMANATAPAKARVLSIRALRPLPQVHRLLRRQCIPPTRVGAPPRRRYSGNRLRAWTGSRSRLKSTA